MRRLIAALVAGIASAAGAEPSALYDRYCLACHGAAGDGRGPAAPLLAPAPRDFTSGRYKWRTTPSGQPPTRADLARAIREGAPGTAMPGFGGILDEAQIAALVVELEGFAPRRFAEPRAAVELPAAPDALPDGEALFASLGCAACHGPAGRGDGPAAATARPFDLTREPLRRGATLADIALTITTGIDGTAMPAMPLPPAELWALATFVDGLRARERPIAPGPLPASAAAPGVGLHLAPQGPPPAALPPAAASLSAEQCARCHARQHREWRRSLHARAMSPGVTGQLHTASAEDRASCLSCHAPLAEQRDPGSLQAEAVSCAGCHVRAHTRHGPPRRADATLLAIPSYPVVVDRRYERSDFCMPCHQLGPDAALEGRPLMDTYREWLTGPYMPRGVQCQHCHMPDREHHWKGVHDPDTVRQGLRVAARRAGGGVEIALENAGAAHYLPTTPTPAIFVTVEATGADGRALPPVTRRIGRHITWDGRRFHQVADTRIPPGRTVRFTVEGARARVRVVVAPDEYYERFYAQLLARRQPESAKRELRAALLRAERSRFTLHDLVVD
jgi:mono/diheme cytochrome c family protein